jgi:Na+/glutamate symporter
VTDEVIAEEIALPGGWNEKAILPGLDCSVFGAIIPNNPVVAWLVTGVVGLGVNENGIGLGSSFFSITGGLGTSAGFAPNPEPNKEAFEVGVLKV